MVVSFAEKPSGRRGESGDDVIHSHCGSAGISRSLPFFDLEWATAVPGFYMIRDVPAWLVDLEMATPLRIYGLALT